MKAPLLMILTVWLNSQYGGCAFSSSCSYPPAQWCSSLDSAIQCGVRSFIDVLGQRFIHYLVLRPRITLFLDGPHLLKSQDTSDVVPANGLTTALTHYATRKL